MAKKFFAVLLVCMLVLMSFSACGTLLSVTAHRLTWYFIHQVIINFFFTVHTQFSHLTLFLPDCSDNCNKRPTVCAGCQYLTLCRHSMCCVHTVPRQDF